MADIRTDNDFLLGSDGKSVSPVLPVRITTRQQAYRTAAWLRLIGGALPNEDIPSSFEEVADAIANT